MPLFKYKAKNLPGESIVNIIEAENIKAAAGKLQSSGYYPVSILPYRNEDARTRFLSLLRTSKVRHKDKVVFTRRLADSLKGGLPLSRALAVLSKQTENRELSVITKEIAAAIQEGKALSEALALYPAVFSTMYVAMVRSGEAAGVLDTVLLRLADFQEKEEELRYKIRAALTYPAVMLLAGTMSVIFLLGFVIPKFEVMFQDLGQSMPAPTRILVFLSRTVRFGWWIYLPLAVLLVLAVAKWRSTGKGRQFLSALKLRLPVLGIFIRKDLISRFLRIVSILLANGVPILAALTIARDSIDNQLFSNDIDAISAKVKEGEELSNALCQCKLFPSFVTEMIAVGEETGHLESSLGKVAETYEREVEYASKTMTSLLEPVIILVAGIVVCFVALSILLPVFQVSAGLH
jgi:type II secretory pathway component PulF